MFTGITQGLYKVISIIREDELVNYTINLSHALSQDLNPGDSVAVDGVCQTVISLMGTHVTFQAIRETLDRTTLSELHLGKYVSIERSVRWGDEVGGHEVSGHVFGTAIIYQKILENTNLTLIIKCDPAWMKYILSKGFVAVDGSSLTVGNINDAEGLFHLHLIPETIRLTNFANKRVGDKVNIEFDHKTKTIVDTIERIMRNHYLTKNVMDFVAPLDSDTST